MSMSKFDKLKKSMDKAEEAYRSKQADFETLITEVLSVFKINNDHYDEIWSNETNVFVNFSWRAAGCNCSDSITLPKSIFDSENPVEAAKLYKIEQDKKTRY